MMKVLRYPALFTALLIFLPSMITAKPTGYAHRNGQVFALDLDSEATEIPGKWPQPQSSRACPGPWS